MKKPKKKSTGYPMDEPVVDVLDGETSAGEALTEAYLTTSSSAGQSGGSHGHAVAYTARHLLTPDEVMRLPSNQAIVMLAGDAPYRANRLNYLPWLWFFRPSQGRLWWFSGPSGPRAHVRASKILKILKIH